MSRRRQTRAIQKFFRKYLKQILQLAVSMTKAMFQWLLRTLMVTRHRRYQTARAGGFVLPTVTLLLVVVALVIGAILFRTSSRTNQVINERNQQVIYNAATPAIDRAKAKLEYLFKRDDRLPNTVPAEAQLMSALLNDGQNNITKLPGNNPYELPDETPISIAGQSAPAWKYQTDIDGDGKKETVAYSIIFKTQDDPNSPSVKREDPDNKLALKANKMVVRNGPITTQKASDPACDRLNLAPESGWDLAGTGSLRKTFQVTAAVISNKNGNRTVSTLEFQQDRELARANKWGAWTRYDLHLYPFPAFRWNGAMHTEGSLFLGGQNSDSVQSYLISAPKSCLYNPASNSEISIGRVKNSANQIEFAGQLVKGAIGGTSSQEATIHIHRDPPTTNRTIGDGTDSVQGTVDAAKAELIALNPVTLFTENKSRSVSKGPDNKASNTEFSIPDWINKEQLPGNTRIIAKTEKPPYVDDTYRADDRLGPKPDYDLEGLGNDVSLGSGLKNGVSINSASLSSEQKKQLTNNTPQPNDVELKTLGLDGYWERRAKVEGLRIIVGPRLELGNTYGWGQDLDASGIIDQPNEFDPLYPIYNSGISGSIPHLQQQRRTLRDNLAAVQATVVYHHTQNSGDIPVACMATMAHPGTQDTINRSKNFRITTQADGSIPATYANYSSAPTFYSDFFTGTGTNGWEYSIPQSQADFTGGPLSTALRNLANFAGDYENENKKGAFPPTQEAGRIHPDPYLTMWGNFSNLRRAIEQPATNPGTGAISIADQSYMHTAGCTLGMLANNVNYFIKSNPAGEPGLGTLRTKLGQLFDTDSGNGQVELNGDGTIKKLVGTDNVEIIPDNSRVLPTPDLWIAAIKNDPDSQKLARLLAMKEQIARDRKLGFAYSSQPTNDLNLDLDSNGTPDKNVPKAALAECKETTFSTFNSGTEILQLLCSVKPKFPSLYYIFRDGTASGDRKIQGSGTNIDEANNREPYILRTQGIANPNGGGFQPISDAQVEQIANQFQPKTPGNWKLPTGGSPTVTDSNPLVNDAFKVRDPNGGDLYVPFIDKGIFDGREMMSLRVLDIDLERLRNNNIGSDRWFPASGIFYTFREDAVREDAIARPSSGAYTEPTNPVNQTNATSPTTPTDPEVNPTTGISPKPVDFSPDPDRRPYGFRLRNGAELIREANNPRGITFVSDNLVAIQGDFNRHTQEEFGGVGNLQDNFSNFYTRTSLNTNFASLSGDKWRPAEILADGITLLSKDFTDGSIEAGLRNDGRHSYRGLRSSINSTWLREDNSSANGTNPSPIKIFRDGNPRNCNAGNPSFCLANASVTLNADFTTDTRRDDLNEATNDTQINAILVSGVIPARKNQGNGGFHNFPRLLETWNGKNLKISGSFIQLNFSTSATGPFDQDAWEPAQAVNTQEYAFHFRPPNRLWGYDVGLQYAPAGPLSRRFITAESPRSEFYEELKANDPYVCNLRRAIATNNPQDATEDPAQVNQECQ